MARRKRKPVKRVPISKPALMARINRKLAGQDKKLFARRDGSGDYHIIDTSKNKLIESRVDPEDKARELGVLQPWERLADGEGEA